MHLQSTASCDDALKSATESSLNGGDNIITISTASINSECHSLSLDGDQLKSSSSPSSQKIVHFNDTKISTEVTPQSHSSSAPGILPGSTAPRHCCHPSQCISFQDNIADVHHRKGRRLHGLQLPLHPLQVFGWLVLVLFGIASFWVLIPSFTSDIQGPLYGLISGLYIVHVVSHLAALLIDPADRELRRVHRNDRIVPEFDRSKHAHVIENGRCHLCNIRTSSPRTKHCSVCNKCVGKFDHHCKWLNHCIGSRNYVAFLMCVVSAVIATVVIVAAVIAQIVFYYVQPEWLSFWQSQPSDTGISSESERAAVAYSANLTLNKTIDALTNVNATEGLELVTNATAFLLENEFYVENSTLPTVTDNFSTLGTANDSLLLLNSTLPPKAVSSVTNVTVATIAGIGVSDTIFLVLIGFLGLLAAITAGLLLHLCFFHIYISFLGLTTYEYIRNHRQAQEAKAKQMISNMPKNGQQHFAINPSKKTTSTDCGQIYCCSSVRHPNAINPADLRYFEARKLPPKTDDESQRNRLHCCINSREYHRSALKTYYMCSLLEEGAATSPLDIAHISGNLGRERSATGDPYDNQDEDDSLNNLKTFHCCSSFGALTTQRKVSAASSKATLVSDLEALSARRSYMQYTEQCTLCTFRIRSPIVAKRSSASSTRTASRQHSALSGGVSQTSKPASASSKVTSAEHQRCCMKAISKHQRWRRKWNCCSNVPDSPDVPNDIIAALALRHQHTASAGSGKKINATEIPVHFIKSVNGSGGGDRSRPNSPRSANLKTQTRAPNARTWPVPRLRHMMRMLSRYRRPRCRHGNVANAAGAGDEQIKQNQVRPLQLHSSINGQCQNHHNSSTQQHYNDSSSPQPPSSTTASSERSDQSIYSDSSTLATTPSTTTSGKQPNTIETILPTSVIRDDTSMTYTTAVGITPPALPPPTRRKIPNPTDLEELAETLSFVSHATGTSVTLSPVQRLPALNNVYRRQRRKHFLRTRSPTLSPIHETGLSNPTSPQPGRHNAAGTAASGGNSTGELARKATSNQSLQSLSSNSSST